MSKELVIGIDLGGKDKTVICYRENKKYKFIHINSIEEAKDQIKKISADPQSHITFYIDGTLSYEITNEKQEGHYKRNFRRCDINWHSYINQFLDDHPNTEDRQMIGNWVKSPNSLYGAVTIHAIAMVKYLSENFENAKFIEIQPRVAMLKLCNKDRESLNTLKEYKYDKSDHDLRELAIRLRLIDHKDHVTETSLTNDQLDALACCVVGERTIEIEKFPANEVTFIDRHRLGYIDVNKIPTR